MRTSTLSISMFLACLLSFSNQFSEKNSSKNNIFLSLLQVVDADAVILAEEQSGPQWMQ